MMHLKHGTFEAVSRHVLLKKLEKYCKITRFDPLDSPAGRVTPHVHTAINRINSYFGSEITIEITIEITLTICFAEKATIEFLQNSITDNMRQDFN